MWHNCLLVRDWLYSNFSHSTISFIYWLRGVNENRITTSNTSTISVCEGGCKKLETTNMNINHNGAVGTAALSQIAIEEQLSWMCVQFWACVRQQINHQYKYWIVIHLHTRPSMCKLHSINTQLVVGWQSWGCEHNIGVRERLYTYVLFGAYVLNAMTVLIRLTQNEWKRAEWWHHSLQHSITTHHTIHMHSDAQVRIRPICNEQERLKYTHFKGCSDWI